MKNRLLIILACIGIGLFNVNAQQENIELSFDENKAVPVVPQKAHNAIVRHMERIAKYFEKQQDEKHDLKIELMRNGEIARITVPCSKLFIANQTELSSEAAKMLNNFNSIIKLPELYKVLIVVHADDTGDVTYADFITEERANSIDEYYLNSLGDNINIIPYAMGNDTPRTSNNSIAGRNENRRVEFYIVPERKLVDQAKAGKL